MRSSSAAMLAAGIVALGVPAMCQPGAPQSVRAIKVEQAPVVDGMLDDACWQRAPDASDFWFPEKGTPAPERTEVWVCCDSAIIYVAFRCHDSRPDSIVAQQKKRGGSVRTDDWVAIDIDPWHTHRTTFWFCVTPRGTQVEELPGIGGTKVEWKGDWLASAKVDNKGWTAEMAIPWSMLKYPKGQDTMGISFMRRHARSDQGWTCPDLGPNEDESLMLDWTGVQPPAPKLNSVVLQYTNVGLGGVGFRNGLDVKKQITQETNALLTVNPDFESVEQSIASIDFTYAPPVLTDNRPFFYEGNDHPDSEYRMFYSRNIEEVDVGAKIAGRTSRQEFSGLVTTAGSGDRHVYGKSMWDYGTNSRAGFALTNTLRPGIENSVGSVYCKLGRRTDKRSDAFEYRLMKSRTAGAGRDGSIISTAIRGGGGPRQLGWRLGYENVSPDYYAADGFVPEPNLRGWDYHLSYGDEYEKGRVRGWELEFEGNDRRLQSGDRLSKELSLHANAWSVGSQLYLGISTNARREEIPGGGGTFAIYYDRVYSLGYGWNQEDMYGRGWADIDFGRRAGGRSLHSQIKQAFRLGRSFSTDLSVEYLRMTGPFARQERQSIATFNYDLTSERSISARLVERSGTVNLSFGYRRAVRKGQDVYILFGDPNADKTRNRVILKLIRPIW